MRKTVLAALMLLTTALPISPVAAQALDKVLVIYGKDRCPTNAAGEEIVVCARRPEGERYRIPKELRQSTEIAPGNQSWAARQQSTTNAGARTGTGSCSAVGAGGWTGCWAEQMRAARAERKANAAAQSTAP